ncbi:MAG TPA: hypothetical protein VMT18_09620, partial [Planctomycetota bacterium]|nr:hypothetical protein [Planctomycetota bacterium]
MRHVALAAVLVAALAAGSCSSLTPDPGPLATSVVARDFATYSLVRVGVPPLRAPDVDAANRAALQAALVAELSAVMPYELVPLDLDDLVEVDAQDAFRRGRYDTRAVLETARRYRLDGLVLGTVTHYQPYPPQALGMEVELVAIETGATLWSSSLQLDAADAKVRARLDRWQNDHKSGGGNRESAQLTLVSPERFARFAASEIAA